VLLLGVKTGWSRRDIMQLPQAEFQLYIDLLISKDKP
jgi:hypothetical protein